MRCAGRYRTQRRVSTCHFRRDVVDAKVYFFDVSVDDFLEVPEPALGAALDVLLAMSFSLCFIKSWNCCN